MGHPARNPSSSRSPDVAAARAEGRSGMCQRGRGSDNGRPPWPAWLLRRTDQAAVAGLVLFGLLGVIGWWLSQGGLQGRLVEIEQAEPRQARFLVDVNTADWPELAQLPGIGETLARRIVETRESGGQYKDFEDLRERVRGIGPATLERIRPHLVPIPPTDGLAGR